MYTKADCLDYVYGASRDRSYPIGLIAGQWIRFSAAVGARLLFTPVGRDPHSVPYGTGASRRPHRGAHG